MITHYRQLGLLGEYRRAEAALHELAKLDHQLWEKLAGWERNVEELTVYEALSRAKRK